MTGKVRRIPEGKQFGFIASPSGDDYFFHMDDYQGNWQSLLDDIRRGKAPVVSFISVESQKGLRAGDVRLLEEEI